MELNDPVPSFSFQTTQSENSRFEDYRGQWIVLYFYPKDATPGCTLESQNFRDQYPTFVSHHATILGVSRDPLRSHQSFKTKQQLPFELISDAEEALCQQFDVIKMKSMYGKQVRGIERSTFLIDPNGILKHVWRKVRVPGHVDAVLATLLKLQENA